jgi:hypothetical protein
MEIVPRAVWTQDCQGKQDFDGPLFSISSRYYPGPSGGGFMSVSNSGIGGAKIETIPYDSQPSAVSTIHLRLGPVENHDGGGDYYVWKRAEFTAPTEAEVKAQVEAWVTERMAEIVTALGGLSQFRAG